MNKLLGKSAMPAIQGNSQLLNNGVIPAFNMQLLSEQGATEYLDNIRKHCEEYCSSFGFSYISYVGYFPKGEYTHALCNFPSHWVDAENETAKYWKDIVSRQCQHRTSPFSWKDIPTESNKAALHMKQLLIDMKHDNIHDGVCVPIHGAGAEWGMLNLAGNNDINVATDDSLRVLQLYAIGVHEAVKHCYEHEKKGMSRIKSLSPRERECLDWIAAGKTAWETAKIVGITESTVSFHIRNTIQKLNASNRAHAVAVAMACSLISNTPH